MCGVVPRDVAHAIAAGRRALDQLFAITSIAAPCIRAHAVAEGMGRHNRGSWG